MYPMCKMFHVFILKINPMTTFQTGFLFHEAARCAPRSLSRIETVNIRQSEASLRGDVSVGGCCATSDMIPGRNQRGLCILAQFYFQNQSFHSYHFITNPILIVLFALPALEINSGTGRKTFESKVFDPPPFQTGHHARGSQRPGLVKQLGEEKTTVLFTFCHCLEYLHVNLVE